MNETEAMDYILKLQGSGIRPGLSRIEELLKRMGNPEKDLHFIHIAGTNGKGSTLTYISSILEKAGYKVGKYISPTIFSYKERFQINGKNISTALLTKGVELIKNHVEAMAEEGLDIPSAFEAETALGFWFFKEKKCDFVALEVGMGGLEDATNVIPAPEVCVLASISYDHMAFLGESLKEIATQKAGIIKTGCSVVSALQHEEAMEVVKAVAQEKGCSFNVVDMGAIKEGRTTGLTKNQTTASKNQTVASKNTSAAPRMNFSYKDYKLSTTMIGRFQLKNAALAVEVVLALRERGYKISDTAITEGIMTATWPVRFQVIPGKPTIVLDGAHNEEAAERLAESVDFYFTNRRIIYIMGMLKDKEIEKVAGIMSGRAESIFTVATPNNPRALPAIELAQIVSHFDSSVTAADSIPEALEMAKLMAGPEGVIIAFGSLSYLGELRSII